MLFYWPVRVGSTAPSNFHNFFQIKQGIAVSFGVFSASCNLFEMLTVWIFSKIVFFSIMALLISLMLMKLFLSTMVQNYSSSTVSSLMKLSCSPVWEKNTVVSNTKLGKMKWHSHILYVLFLFCLSLCFASQFFCSLASLLFLFFSLTVDPTQVLVLPLSGSVVCFSYSI